MARSFLGNPGDVSGPSSGPSGVVQPNHVGPGSTDGYGVADGSGQGVTSGGDVQPSWGIGDDPLANGLGYDPNEASSKWENWLKNQRNQPRNNPAYDTANQGVDRNNQSNLIQQMLGLANGDPNSAAQQQLRGAYQASRAQQNALSLSGREGTAGSRGMHAAMNNGASQQGQAVDSKMLMMHEQAAAQAALAQMYAQQQMGDINNSNNLAQTSIHNAAANDAMNQFYAQFGANNTIGDYQRTADATNAALGYGLDSQNFQQQFAGMAAQGAGTLLNSAGTMWGNSYGGGGGDASPLYALANNPYPQGSDPSEWSNPYGNGGGG